MGKQEVLFAEDDKVIWGDGSCYVKSKEPSHPVPMVTIPNCGVYIHLNEEAKKKMLKRFFVRLGYLGSTKNLYLTLSKTVSGSVHKGVYKASVYNSQAHKSGAYIYCGSFFKKAPALLQHIKTLNKSEFRIKRKANKHPETGLGDRNLWTVQL
jgi:hypothetical protein